MSSIPQPKTAGIGRAATASMLAVVGIVGAVGAHNRTNAALPAHLRRRVKTSRELFEAAQMAEKGDALPGTNAAVQLAQAYKDGNFARAHDIAAFVKAYAPEIRREAERAAEQERREAEFEGARVRRAGDAFERADAKRKRKNGKRARDHGALGASTVD